MVVIQEGPLGFSVYGLEAPDGLLELPTGEGLAPNQHSAVYLRYAAIVPPGRLRNFGSYLPVTLAKCKHGSSKAISTHHLKPGKLAFDRLASSQISIA